MLSLQATNVIINAALWFVQGFVARLMESIYVSISKLQLQYTGATRATDSTELDIFQWIPSECKFCTSASERRSNGTAYWVFLLILFMLCFLPAELVVETGIDERKDGSPTLENQTGICATPWMGQSAVLAASSAMLVQIFSWVDSDWDVVYEGSSMTMKAVEVHREGAVPLALKESTVSMAYDCHVSVSKCAECGTMSVGKDEVGAFEDIITNASLGETQMDVQEIEKRCPHAKDLTRTYRPYSGDMTYDFRTGMAFFFWALPCESVVQNGQEIYRIGTQGIEAIMTKNEVDMMLKGQQKSWNLSLNSNRTRMYEITCKSPGLGWKDLMTAVSLYRTVQLTGPGLKRNVTNFKLSRVSPLERKDVLKSLFSLKAADIRSRRCERLVPMYRQCGTFKWIRAGILLGLCLFMVVSWILLEVLSNLYPSVHVPFNSESWRKIALRDEGKANQNSLSLGKEYTHIVMKTVEGSEDFSTVNGRNLI